MGIKIDEHTQIIYENHIINVEEIAKDYSKWEGARKVSANIMLSKAPEEQLVLRDIFDSPLEIIRDKKYGNLVLQASIVRRKNEIREFDRPYKAITLTPIEGQVDSVKNLRNKYGGINFRLKEGAPTHITFDSIKNYDLEMRVNYQAK